jgi:hypothetical protein
MRGASLASRFGKRKPDGGSLKRGPKKGRRLVAGGLGRLALA